MTRYFAGIDGGQSSTAAVIGDETGRILARGRAGPADEVGAQPGSTRLHGALHAALAEARARARLPERTVFSAIVAGVSGYEGRVYGQPPELPAAHVELVHDAPIAHAGALAGERGVVAVAGTGSVVYLGGEGTPGRMLGGWGFLFGDEGSAFWIAREILARLMRDEDAGDLERIADAMKACSFFGVDSLRGLARACYSGAIARDRLAAYAAQAADDFGEIVERGADALAQLTCRAIDLGGTPVVALVGGTFANEHFRGRVERRVREAFPQVEMREPRYDPAVGALLLAYRAAGLPIAGLPA